MDINASFAEQALREALNRYPEMAGFGPRLVCRPVFGGVTYLVEYAAAPPREHPDAWEFQNAAVKAYKRLTGA